MAWATVILAVGLAAGTVGWICLMLAFWSLRNEYAIAVRSPPLIMVMMITCLVMVQTVLLQFLLQSIDKSLPCFVLFCTGYAILAFCATPGVIRAARLVVAFNKRLRGKYARFVKSTSVNRVWMAITVALATRAAFFFGSKPEHYSRDARECFYMDDTTMNVALSILVGPFCMYLAIGVSRANDSFSIREELFGSFSGCVGVSVLVVGIQVLVNFKIVRDTPQVHLVVELLILLFGINGGIWSLVVPMAKAYRSGLRPWSRSNVVPVLDNIDVMVTSDTDGVIALATKGGEICLKFGAFCRNHLCQESWDFIVDVTKYEKMVLSDPDKQYDAFVHILNQYLLPSSPDEVNISSTLSERMASFRTREVFMQLADEQRRTILREPLLEIARMLEQNLLHIFWSKVASERAMPTTEENLTEVVGGDRELMALMRASSRAREKRP